MENRHYLRVIYIVSIAIPVVVAFLIYSPPQLAADGTWIRVLPKFHAIINSLTTVILIIAYFAIKKKKVNLHRGLMVSALLLGVLFLLSYVTYHASAPSVKYGDFDHDGILSIAELEKAGYGRSIYIFILLSHIFLSIGVVPLVLLSFQKALSGQIVSHKKLVKFTLPIWLYVSVTGVIVYIMISPYYF